MTHPYANLPKEAFWRRAVSDHNPLETNGLWKAKWPIAPTDKVVTFGSCFAQHISQAIQENGFTWMNCEPGPEFVSKDLNKKFNYDIYSARTGNIYSTKALWQWMSWSLGEESVPEEIWSKNDRSYDPFRPAIEPGGFASRTELVEMRNQTLAAFARCAREADIFIFTMGLTESWEHKTKGYTYATCPGTNAGEFDPEQHVFRNYNYNEVRSDLVRTIDLLRRVNPDVRVLLTVSPVPLTATVSGKHVTVSTTYSKSVLRAVAGELSDGHSYIDYFPSYEIISAPPFRGMFYNPNMRTVSKKGVEFVMSHFLSAIGADRARGQSMARLDDPSDAKPEQPPEAASEDDLVCEEAILEAFAK